MIQNKIFGRPFYSIILCFLLGTGIFATSKAESIHPAIIEATFVENLVDSNEYLIELSKNISLADELNKTYVGSNQIADNLIDDLKDNGSVKVKSSEIKVIPSEGNYMGGCENENYHIEISGPSFGNGWDITSVTICGVEVCHILIQSSNQVIVYPASGTPGTGDIVITSKSRGKTIIENGFTYQVPKPDHQAKITQFSKLGETSGNISWNRGNGVSCVVFVKQADSGLAPITNNTTFSGETIIGKGAQIGKTGWYCVYNGIGSSVSVSGLESGKNYVAQAFEYNGPFGYETYLNSSATMNLEVQNPSLTNIHLSSAKVK